MECANAGSGRKLTLTWLLASEQDGSRATFSTLKTAQTTVMYGVGRHILAMVYDFRGCLSNKGCKRPLQIEASRDAFRPPRPKANGARLPVIFAFRGMQSGAG